MSAVDKCINRLIFLEGEVNFLRSKVEEYDKWRRRMESWLKSRFDYDLNHSDEFRIEGQGMNLPSTSKSISSASMSNSNTKYFSKGTSLKPKLSITQGNTRLKRSTRGYQQIVEYADHEEPTLTINTSPTSNRRRKFISDILSVKMESSTVEIEDHEIGVSWGSEEADEIDVEPCFALEPEVEIKEESQRNKDGLNISGDEWEIYNSDEEDEESHKFRVIGYEQDRAKIGNEADFPGFVLEDSLNFSDSGEEPRTSVTSTFQRPRPPRLRKIKNMKTNLHHKSLKPLSSSSRSVTSVAVYKNAIQPKISLSTLVKNKGGFQSIQQSRLQRNLSHILQKDNDVKKPNCPYCGKPFNTPAEMMRHQRIHVGDKPFSCYVCEYSTSFNGDLVRHLKSRHPGKDPYVCHLCSFKCKELLMFTDHRRRTGHGGRGAKRLQAQRS